MNDKLLNQLQKKYPVLSQPSERTLKAVAIYKIIARQAINEGWQVIFLSGLATDAHFGYLTRQHRDADLMTPRDTAQKIKIFLESEGHTVYEPDKVKGECLKVDQAEPGSPMHCHCDIHYFWEDENSRVTIPLLGKELKLSTSAKEASEEIEFLGEKALFLRPQYIIEEKIGWRDKIGLEQRAEYVEEVEKIKYLMEVLDLTI
ncbi:MAG TPA: hypothetical protein VJC12_01810 [Candidatus Paceibacterota bacterium]